MHQVKGQEVEGIFSELNFNHVFSSLPNRDQLENDSLRIEEKQSLIPRVHLKVLDNNLFTFDDFTINREPDSIGKQRYRVYDFLLTWMTLKDEFLSPLTYYGPAIGVRGSTIVAGHRSVRVRNLSIQLGILKNYTNESSLIAPRVDFDYSYLRRFYQSDDNRIKLYFGGSYNLMLLGKYLPQNINNVLSFDVSTTLDLSGMVDYHFSLLNKDFTITNQLSVPIIGAVLRPEYAWSTPYFIAEPDAAVSESVELVFFGEYLRFQNIISLYFKSKKSGTYDKPSLDHWRISYKWDYHQINIQNLSQSATHVVSLGRVFKF